MIKILRPFRRKRIHKDLSWISNISHQGTTKKTYIWYHTRVLALRLNNTFLYSHPFSAQSQIDCMSVQAFDWPSVQVTRAFSHLSISGEDSEWLNFTQGWRILLKATDKWWHRCIQMKTAICCVINWSVKLKWACKNHIQSTSFHFGVIFLLIIKTIFYLAYNVSTHSFSNYPEYVSVL